MLKDIKHQFMAFRNGIVADSLRKAGFPHKVIFGLQLPQISEIASRQIPSAELAEALWKDEEVRESRLLAPYLYPREEMDKDKAIEYALSVRTPEEADILVFRLLRHLPFASEVKEGVRQVRPEAYVIKAFERFDI